VKNLNSLRSLGRAIDHEAERQIALLTSGGRVVQETRHWNEAEGRTSSMRSKEEAYDYRYFSEPDLVPLDPDEEFVAEATVGIGLMPAARRRRLAALVSAQADGTVAPQAADQIETAVALGLDELVVKVVGLGADPRLALARAANEAAQRPDEARHLDAGVFAELLGLEVTGKLSATQAKTVLAELLEHGGDPEEIARRLGYEALGDDALGDVLDQVIAEHPAEWDRYRGGEDKVAQLFTGLVMKATKGRANGRAVAEALAARRD
jgi:aspartyl-tRNA(Asn)/glutamyl-tRNA(Gln) amidotransferase subunit B